MRLVSLLFSCAALLVAVSPAAANQSNLSPLAEARAELEQLDDLLGDRRAPVADVVVHVTLVADRHRQLDAPDAEREAFRRDVEAVLLEALSKDRVREDANVLEPVNVAAARALSAIGPTLDAKVRGRLWKRVRRAVGALHDVRGYEPSDERMRATFEALARVGTADTLVWLLEEYSHTKQNEASFLAAAHRAMVLFDDVDGRLRHEIVKRFIAQYASVESLAEQSVNSVTHAAKRRLWDRIRTFTIAVVQKSAQFPGEDGVAYARMEDLQSWFRDHKDPRRAPWV